MISLKSTLPEVFDHNLLEKESDSTVVIYCDMDGVIADFDKGIMQLSNGKAPSEFDKEGNPQGMWDLIRGQSDKGIEFWATLPKIEPDADMLWKFINSLGYTVKILSSTGSRESKSNSADIGKRTWLSTKLIPVPQEENIILVDSSDAKRQYAAGPNHILIDDLPKNISQWRSAGGVAIEHKNAAQTIAELKRILGVEAKTKESYGYSWSNV
jgi:hypothetical protein